MSRHELQLKRWKSMRWLRKKIDSLETLRAWTETVNKMRASLIYQEIMKQDFSRVIHI